MPRYDASIPAFNGGEWSGRMRGRVDLEAYKRACSLMENWEPFAQGSMRRRPGTKYLLDLSGPVSGSTMRLGTVHTARAGDFGFFLADQQVQVFDANGVPVTNSVLDAVQNGTFDAAGAYWTVGGVGVQFLSGRAYLGTYPVSGFGTYAGWLRQTVGPFTAADLAVRLECYNPVNYAGVEYGTITLRLGSTLGGAERGTVALHSGITTLTLTGVTGSVYLEVLGSHSAVLGGANPSWVDNISVLPTDGSAAQFVAPWEPGDIGDVQWAEDTGGDRVIFVHPKYEPRVLSRSVAGTWAFNAPSWTNKPTTWTGSNWPSVVEVYQGRLWLAAPPDAPTTFWGSKSGDFFNFTLGTNPGDAFSYVAATKNAIRWLRGHRVMMAGAVNAELAISAASVIVGPGDVDVREESAFGSASAMAVKAGNEVLYISGDRKKIRSIRYDFQTAGWVSDDITDFAEHLFVDEVDELHYGRDPNNALIAVMKSGELRICTYSPAQKVLAWWRWTTPGVVISATVLRRGSETLLWMLVSRNGINYWLEEQPLGEPVGVQYLDCHSAQTLTGTSSPGWDRFIGQSVEVLIDGAVEPDVVVAGDGSITTEREGISIVAGLGYTCSAKTLPPEGGNPAGTSQGMSKRWVDLMVRLNRSALPTINGARPANQRSVSTPLDSPEALFTGDVKLTNPRGDSDGALVIEQDLPLRTEVCAIFGTVQQDKV